VTVTILQGDCRDLLKALPDQSVQCVVTSPPYFGLRDYGTGTWTGGDPACNHVVGEIRTGLGLAKLGERYAGGGRKANEPKPMTAKSLCPTCGARRVDSQIGLEPTPAEFVAEIVAVFREVRRVLRSDGTAWLNLGDSFASGGGTGAQGSRGQRFDRRHTQETLLDKRNWPEVSIKPKDLMGIPWRVAFALQDDGWYLRRDIIWSKPNPMPESCTDRPTTAHEYLFLLTKSGHKLLWTHRDGRGTRKAPDPDYRWAHRTTGEERATAPDGWPEIGKAEWRRINLWSGSDYFYDAEAVREPMAAASIARLSQDVESQAGSLRANGGAKTNGPMKAVAKGNAKTFRGGGAYTQGRSFDNDGVFGRESHGNAPNEGGSRNLRSVWTIATQPFSEAHFATFPPKLAETCILAGTSEMGACPACGAPWARTITKGEPDEAHRSACGADGSGGYNGRSIKNHDAAGVQNASDVKRRILEGLRKKTYGWRPTCDCLAADPVPCVVLDCFGGAGTVGLVADRLHRDAILIELNPTYADMARRRITKDAGLFAEVTDAA
jgi:DNA modification methylase